jgi:lysophospholipase L1-like esterase
VHYVTVTKILRTALEDESMTADDGLHPSGRMYALWVAELLTSAIKIVKSTDD